MDPEMNKDDNPTFGDTRYCEDMIQHDMGSEIIYTLGQEIQANLTNWDLSQCCLSPPRHYSMSASLFKLLLMPECVPNVTIVTRLTHISASPLYSSNILPETWTFLVCSPEHRKDLLSKYYTAKSQNDVFYNCNHLPGGFLCCWCLPRAVEERYDYTQGELEEGGNRLLFMALNDMELLCLHRTSF